MIKQSENIELAKEQIKRLNSQIKSLQKEMKIYTTQLKKEMINNGDTKIPYGDVTFILTSSVRNKIKDKDNLLYYLINNDLKSCIDTEIKPNVQRMKEAVMTGKMSQEILDTYVSQATVNTFKVE